MRLTWNDLLRVAEDGIRIEFWPRLRRDVVATSLVRDHTLERYEVLWSRIPQRFYIRMTADPALYDEHRVSSGLSLVDEQKVTLIHELIHGARLDRGQTSFLDEPQIDALAYALQRAPDADRFLLRILNHPKTAVVYLPASLGRVALQDFHDSLNV